MLHILVMDAVGTKVSTNIDVHFHLWVPAVVGQGVYMRSRMWHIVRQQCTFIQVSPLIDLLSV